MFAVVPVRGGNEAMSYDDIRTFGMFVVSMTAQTSAKSVLPQTTTLGTGRFSFSQFQPIGQQDTLWKAMLSHEGTCNKRRTHIIIRFLRVWNWVPPLFTLNCLSSVSGTGISFSFMALSSLSLFFSSPS